MLFRELSAAFLGSSPRNAKVDMMEQSKETKLVQLDYELFALFIYFCYVSILKLHPSFLSFCSTITLSQSGALLCFFLQNFIPSLLLMRILKDCLDSRLPNAPRSISNSSPAHMAVFLRMCMPQSNLCVFSNCPFQSSLPSSNDVAT